MRLAAALRGWCRPLLGQEVSFAECWDAHACVAWIDDPSGLSGVCTPAGAPCSRGDAAVCPL